MNKKYMIGAILIIGAVFATSAVLIDYYITNEANFDVSSLFEWDDVAGEDLTTFNNVTDFLPGETMTEYHTFNASADIDTFINTTWTWDNSSSALDTEGLACACYVNVSGAGEYLLCDDTSPIGYIDIYAGDDIDVRLVYIADPLLQSGDYQWLLTIS